MNNVAIDISIIIATYNRANILRETLESLAALSPSSIRHEILVIDNNSVDQTRQVVESYVECAPVRYLFEEKQGKNHALNTGLKVAQGELHIFTDDDVCVPSDWTVRYWVACRKYAEADFLGGSVIARLPPDAPRWMTFRGVDLAEINNGPVDRPIERNESLLGANMAVRKRVFDAGLTFDPSIGPSSSTKRKGSETSFIADLHQRNYKGWYIADVPVEHRVDCHPFMFRRSCHWQRKFTEARGRVYMGLSDPGTRFIGNLPLTPFVEVFQTISRFLSAQARFWNFERRVDTEMKLAYMLGRAYEFLLQTKHGRYKKRS